MSVGEDGVVSIFSISASVAPEIGCSARAELWSRSEPSQPASHAHAETASPTAVPRRMMEFIDLPAFDRDCLSARARKVHPPIKRRPP